MRTVLASITVVVVIAIIRSFIPKDKFADGLALQRKFESAGSLRGMTKAQLVALVGQPTSISRIAAGEFLHWHQKGFLIIIFFDNKGVFSEVTHKNIYRALDVQVSGTA